MPELRKDPVVGRWVIIASERARRPGNFIEVNDYGCGMTGYTREELLNLTPLDIDRTTPEVAKKIIESPCGRTIFKR